MTDKKKIQLLREYGYHNSETRAIGDGQWSIEVYGWNSIEDNKEFLFEIIGSNGTKYGEEPDDLHGRLSEILDKAFPEDRSIKSEPVNRRRR